jgi:hypothetical protein
MKVLVSPQTHQDLLLSVLFMIALLVSVKCYLIIVSICISQMTDNVQHLFHRLEHTHTHTHTHTHNFFEKSLFISSVHFIFGFFVFYSFSFWVFLVVVGPRFGLRALCLQSRHSTTWATAPVHFALIIVDMRFHELFFQAVLKPWSSQSQSPK